MKHRTDISIVSVRLPASLYLAVQRVARRRSVEEDRTVSGPQIIRELAQREFGANGWNPDGQLHETTKEEQRESGDRPSMDRRWE